MRANAVRAARREAQKRRVSFEREDLQRWDVRWVGGNV
jgi:hypothetical protein